MNSSTTVIPLPWPLIMLRWLWSRTCPRTGWCAVVINRLDISPYEYSAQRALVEGKMVAAVTSMNRCFWDSLGTWRTSWFCRDCWMQFLWPWQSNLMRASLFLPMYLNPLMTFEWGWDYPLHKILLADSSRCHTLASVRWVRTCDLVNHIYQSCNPLDVVHQTISVHTVACMMAWIHLSF